MIGDTVSLTINLKDGNKVSTYRNYYMGWIWAEGFGLKDLMKVQKDKIVFSGRCEKEEVADLEDFLNFIFEDLGCGLGEDNYIGNYQDYAKFFDTIKDIKNIDSIDVTIEIDEEMFEVEEDEEIDNVYTEHISFKKYIG